MTMKITRRFLDDDNYPSLEAFRTNKNDFSATVTYNRSDDKDITIELYEFSPAASDHRVNQRFKIDMSIDEAQRFLVAFANQVKRWQGEES